MAPANTIDLGTFERDTFDVELADVELEHVVGGLNLSLDPGGSSTCSSGACPTPRR
jgi:hypothetical protein